MAGITDIIDSTFVNFDLKANPFALFDSVLYRAIFFYCFLLAVKVSYKKDVS